MRPDCIEWLERRQESSQNKSCNPAREARRRSPVAIHVPELSSDYRSVVRTGSRGGSREVRRDGLDGEHAVDWVRWKRVVKARSLRRSIASVLLLAGVASIIQCGSPDAPSRPEAIFQIRACRGSRRAPDGEVFRILLRDSETIAQARALVGAGNRRIVAGSLARGDGGFNAPWSWHFDPGTVRFPEAAIELCDGCPSDVETNGGTWGLGTFCPWSSEIIAEQK